MTKLRNRYAVTISIREIHRGIEAEIQLQIVRVDLASNLSWHILRIFNEVQLNLFLIQKREAIVIQIPNS